MVSQEEVLGELLYHGSSTHIHFMIRYKGEDIFPNNFFSQNAKNLFDSLFGLFVVMGESCVLIHLLILNPKISIVGLWIRET